jgi:RNA polymerase primary sigma factor
MNDKIKFQDMLKDILEVARVQGNHLSIEEIKTLFGNMELSESQYDQIYAYLAANHIKIQGYIEQNNTSSILQYTKSLKQEESMDELETGQSEEEVRGENKTKEAEDGEITHADSAYLKMYLEDLSAIKPLSDEEEKSLFIKVKAGDSIAKSRLIEGYLSYVVTVARKYMNRGTLLEDLIQEGNIGLMSCLEDTALVSHSDKLKELIQKNIKDYLEAAVGLEIDTDSFENRFLEKIKYISETSKELSEDLGRDPDIYELSDKTKIPLEDLKDILSISGETVKFEIHHHGHK